MMKHIVKIPKHITRFFTLKNDMSNLGRWNLNHNSDIKANLANMDCCGDSLCGNPHTFTNSINDILNKKDISNK